MMTMPIIMMKDTCRSSWLSSAWKSPILKPSWASPPGATIQHVVEGGLVVSIDNVNDNNNGIDNNNDNINDNNNDNVNDNSNDNVNDQEGSGRFQKRL